MIRMLLKGRVILIRSIVSGVFFIMFLTLTAEAGQNIMTVNYPPDNTVMEFGPLSVSVSVPQGAADTITVGSSGEDVLKIVPVNGVACFSVPLSVGINRLSIAAVY
ncbi:MAG: hypothetical protein OEU95_05385, partial [Nitrospirota bacterium]|nr:hypothetical protein [Nitrospirota bacterium]